MDDMVKIKPARNASQRTKNRIREHGSIFKVHDARNSVICLANQPGIRLEAQTRRASDGKGGKESWQGWLPLAEVEVEPMFSGSLAGRTFPVRIFG